MRTPCRTQKTPSRICLIRPPCGVVGQAAGPGPANGLTRPGPTALGASYAIGTKWFVASTSPPWTTPNGFVTARSSASLFRKTANAKGLLCNGG